MPHMTTEIPEDDHDDNLPEANEPAQNSADLGPTRCGFVALIGVPNAGKSTLMNRLIGMKVSIVSRKVQTTRTLVRGIAMQGQAQLIFVDTPGIFAPRRRLDRAMVTSAWSMPAKVLMKRLQPCWRDCRISSSPRCSFSTRLMPLIVRNC
jgi:GTPase